MSLNCGFTEAGFPEEKQFLFKQEFELKAWLEGHQNLKKLNLSGNTLDYRTATIIKALGRNTSLKQLILNRIYTAGEMMADTFVEDLQRNKTLRSFSFQDNPIGYVDMAHMITWLEQFTSLVEIDLMGTDCCPPQFKKIQDLLERNKANTNS